MRRPRAPASSRPCSHCRCRRRRTPTRHRCFWQASTTCSSPTSCSRTMPRCATTLGYTCWAWARGTGARPSCRPQPTPLLRALPTLALPDLRRHHSRELQLHPMLLGARLQTTCTYWVRRLGRFEFERLGRLGLDHVVGLDLLGRLDLGLLGAAHADALVTWHRCRAAPVGTQCGHGEQGSIHAIVESVCAHASEVICEARARARLPGFACQRSGQAFPAQEKRLRRRRSVFTNDASPSGGLAREPSTEHAWNVPTT